jgi:hypothetical protein
MSDLVGWGKLRWGMSFDDVARLHPEYRFTKWPSALDENEFGKRQHACVIQMLNTEWSWSPAFSNENNGLTLIEIGHTVNSLNERELNKLYDDCYKYLNQTLGVNSNNYTNNKSTWLFPNTHFILTKINTQIKYIYHMSISIKIYDAKLKKGEP